MAAQRAVLKPRGVEARLKALGFEAVRQKDSRRQYRHPDVRCTALLFHPGCDVSPTLLRQVARDIGMDLADLLAATAPAKK